MEVRPRDGVGLPEVGFGSRVAEYYTPGASCLAIGELRQGGGNMVQSKRKWEGCLQAAIGHRRRPGSLPPEKWEASSRVVFTRPVTCVNIRDWWLLDFLVM